MSLRQRIWLNMGLIALSSVLVAGLLALRALDLQNAVTQVENDDVLGHALYLQALSLLVEVQSNTHDYLSGDADDIDEFKQNVATLEATMHRIESIEAEEIESVNEVREKVASYIQSLQKDIYESYDPLAEQEAIRRADLIEHRTGRILLEAIDDLQRRQRDRLYQAPNRDDITLQKWARRLDAAVDTRIAAIGEYANGEAEDADEVSASRKRFLSALEVLMAQSPEPDRASLASIGSLEKHLTAAEDRILTDYNPTLKSHAREAADRLEHRVVPSIRAMLQSSAEAENADLNRSLARVVSEISQVRDVAWISVAIVMFLGFLTATRVGRDLDQTIARAVSLAKRLAASEVRPSEVETASSIPECRELLTALVDMANHLRDRRRQAEDADAASASKSRFLAHISHEIRSPLTAILGFTELAIRECDKQNASQLDRLNRIDAAGKHLRTLINGVLEMSKIEAGQLGYSEVLVDLHEILHEVTGFLAAPGKPSVRLKIGPGVPNTVAVDAGKVRQVCSNLIANAQKYGAGAVVRVHVDGAAGDSDRECRISVKVEDDGPGIPSASLENIFQPFERGTERDSNGAGLGLALCRAHARRLGGDVTVTSVMGEGSVFEFTFVAAVHRSQFYSTPDTGLLAEEAWEVLIVDDLDANRELMVALVEGMGLTARAVQDGETAIDEVRAKKPDIILLDLGLPGLDGYQVLEKIRSSMGLSDIPIVAVTASALRHDEERAYAAGFNGFVRKPIDVDVLEVTIRRCMRAGEVDRTLVPRLGEALVAGDLSSARGLVMRWGVDKAVTEEMLQALEHFDTQRALTILRRTIE